jgi:RimJ/RimL family protein N-acetyltransferase
VAPGRPRNQAATVSAGVGPSNGEEVVVRRARPEDLDELLDLFESVAAEGIWIGSELPFDRQAKLRQLRESVDGSDRVAQFVASTPKAIVGQLWIELKPYNVAELGMLVHDRWRGRGIGSALLEQGLDWARRSGAHKVSLQVWPHNRVARRLYDRFGFTEEGRLRRHYRRRNGELWDVIVMGLVLDHDSPGSSLDEAAHSAP